MQAITLALPMSSAATRSTSSPGPSVSSITAPPFHDRDTQERLPAGVTGDQETDSRARSDNAWPLADSRRQTVRRPGHVPSTGDVGGQPRRFSRPQGVAAGDTADCKNNLTDPRRVVAWPGLVMAGPPGWTRDGGSCRQFGCQYIDGFDVGRGGEE